MRYHLIHISKTGGSVLRDVFKSLGKRTGIVPHGHGRKLHEIPSDERAFFIVRDPVKRFVSGFNSRLRKGQPLRFHDWNEKERVTFARFASAGDLARGLASDDPAAREAMDSMIHTRRTQASWIGTVEQLETMLDRVVFVGHQPTLTADFELLKKRLGVDPAVALPSDERAHATPEGFDTALDEAGREAVADWYAEDYRLYRRCLELRATLLAEIAAS